MLLEHYPVERLKREILDVIGRHLDLREYRVFFFGSRVTGRAVDRSDVDVGIEGTEEIPISVMGMIRDEVADLPTLYTVDVVDFKVVSEGFRRTALTSIEPIAPGAG